MTSPLILSVCLYGKQIGTLTLLPGDATLFAFDERYVEDGERPVLSLSYKDAYGGLITESRPVRTSLPPFFSNLLPEGALRHYLAGLAGVKEKREFYLLAALGQDLPGAVTVDPVGGIDWPFALPAKGDAKQKDEKNQDQFLRFSLAGVQLKFSGIMETHGGMTIPAQGSGGDWIVKLPSASYTGVPENEYSMMELARAIGIDVPEVKLIPVSSVANLPEGIDKIEAQAFAIRRFDRAETGERIHMEDFAQVFGVRPDDKYERASYRSIAEVIWTEIGAESIEEFVRRLVFNALIGNADMHLKNWSLVYPDQHQAVLAPAYDFVSTIAYLPDDSMALSLAGRSKRFADLSKQAFKRFAAKARLPEKLVIDTVSKTKEKFEEVWQKEKEHLPLSKNVIEVIEKHKANVLGDI